MKLTAALCVVAVTSVLAAPQEIRVVTTDVKEVLPKAMAAGGQPMKTGTGVIFGLVTEADSNRPVPGAIVTINLGGAQPLRVMADGQGRFGFREMPAGAFNLTATRPGWVDGAYGRTRPGGPTLPLPLAAGERVSGVVVPLWRYATIAGTVMDESGDPLVNAPVRVLKRSSIGGQTSLKEYQQDTTDDRGAYRVSQLEPGEYVVVVPMQQPLPDLSFAVSDKAVREYAVQAFAVKAVARSGGDVAYVVDAMMGSGPFAGLGEDGRPLAFATMFYPNAPVSSRAGVITVSSGEERGAVDFQLSAVPVSHVSGTATGPDGVVPNLQLTLAPAEAEGSAAAIETLTGATDGQGRFAIDGVPPGQYILRAVRMPKVGMVSFLEAKVAPDGAVIMRSVVSNASGSTPLPTDPTLWAEMPLAVGTKDVIGVAVALLTGVRMTGIIQFNGTAERPAPDRLAGSMGVALEPADPRPGVSSATGRVEASGQFATMGVPPGRYFVRVKAGMRGWTFQSALVNGHDASVDPVVLGSDIGGVTLVFTDRPSELSGQVTSDGPLEAATVLVFPAESSAWVGYGAQSRRFSNTRADRQGRFTVTALPAGDYLAVAIPDKMANDWQNPTFLESLVSAATRVRVRDNERVTTTLKVIR